jgi:hypothetical protein
LKPCILVANGLGIPSLAVARVVNHDVYPAKVGDGRGKGLFDLLARGDIEADLEHSLLVGEI